MVIMLATQHSTAYVGVVAPEERTAEVARNATVGVSN